MLKLTKNQVEDVLNGIINKLNATNTKEMCILLIKHMSDKQKREILFDYCSQMYRGEMLISLDENDLIN